MDGISIQTKAGLAQALPEDYGSKRTDMRNEPEPDLKQSVGKLKPHEKAAQDERSSRKRESNPYKISRGVYGD